MTMTAVYTGDNGHYSVMYDASPGTIIGNTYEDCGRRPKYFITPKGVTQEEKDYLEDYCSAKPRY